MESAAAAKEWTAHAEIPVDEILLAASVPLPLKETANVGIDARSSDSTNVQERYIAPDAQIFLVQYRKVRYEWLRKGDIEHSSLERKSLWRTFGILRSGDGPDEHFLAVDLEDSLGLQQSEKLFHIEDGDYIM